MGIRIATEHTSLLFRKVGYSRHQVPSEMFETNFMVENVDSIIWTWKYFCRFDSVNCFYFEGAAGETSVYITQVRGAGGKAQSRTRYLLTASLASQPAISLFTISVYELLMNVYLTYAVRISLFSWNSIYLSICGSTALVDLGRFFRFLIYTQPVGLLARGISPSQGRYLHTEQHKHIINAHRHLCLEWDSNPRSQCSNERRWFMPSIARPLWSALSVKQLT
jgi:hypothetical protein